MKIYLVQSPSTKQYLRVEHGPVYRWELAISMATVFHSEQTAENAGKCAFNEEYDATSKFEIVGIVTVIDDNLIEQVYDLAIRLWNRHCNFPGGHPGVSGPSSADDNWDMASGILAGAAKALEEVLAWPDAVKTLRDLFEAGSLDDHFYHIRDSECEGWHGPRMEKWGAACEAAHQLMDGK